MATNHNRRFALAQRRQKVTDLYLQGWSEVSIAAELNVSQATVSSDVQYVRKKWEASAIRNFDELRTRELQKLDYIEREAWAAWQRSQKPAQSAVVNGEGNGERARKTLKNQYGDPRFLDQVNKCISQRRAITGLDAPLEVTEVPTPETPLILLSREERTIRLDQIAVRLGLNRPMGSDPQILLPPASDPLS